MDLSEIKNLDLLNIPEIASQQEYVQEGVYPARLLYGEDLGTGDYFWVFRILATAETGKTVKAHFTDGDMLFGKVKLWIEALLDEPENNPEIVRFEELEGKDCLLMVKDDHQGNSNGEVMARFKSGRYIKQVLDIEKGSDDLLGLSSADS
jgi:hypothetical protein